MIPMWTGIIGVPVENVIPSKAIHLNLKYCHFRDTQLIDTHIRFNVVFVTMGYIDKMIHVSYT